MTAPLWLKARLAAAVRGLGTKMLFEAQHFCIFRHSSVKHSSVKLSKQGLD